MGLNISAQLLPYAQGLRWKILASIFSVIAAVYGTF